MKSFYVFFIFVSLSVSAFAKSTWEQSALKLSGDPELRKQGIEELKKYSGLNEKLRENYATKKDLVLTVISTLQLREFFPRLLESVELTKAKDLKWNTVTTTASISQPTDEKKLTGAFAKKLEEKNLSDATVAALLNGLQKYNYPVSEKKLSALLNHPSYELRIISVQMAAQLKYFDLVQKATTLKPYQLRLEAYTALSNNADSAKAHRAEIKKSCADEKNDEVKEACSKVIAVIK